MRWSYETLGANTYLVYELDPSETIDGTTLGMLTNNRIGGLAPVLFTQSDDLRYLKYNVTAKVAASQVFGGIVNRNRLLGVFASIVSALNTAEEYMIDASSLIIDLNSVFIDISTNAAELICLPVVSAGNPDLDLRAFFKGILVNTQFDKSENGDYVMKLISQLNASGHFSPSEFGKFVAELSNEKKRAPIPEARKPVPVPPAPPPSAYQAPPPHPSTDQAPPPPVQPVAAKAPVPAPQAKAAPQPVASPHSAAPGADEKEISLFYLLQHYNAENKALYDVQKRRKKEQGGQRAAKQQSKEPKAKKAKKSKQPPDGAFAVPGREISPVNVPGTPPQTFDAQPAVAPQFVAPAPQYAPPQSAAPPRPEAAAYIPPAPQTGFGDTVMFDNETQSDATVMLGYENAQKENRARPHLIRQSNNERIAIDKPIFRIGRDRSFVDYCISENNAIGRSHANIITDGNRYCVLDTNSKNHTYVNGAMITGSTEVEITHGTKLRLANEEFEFRLY
ncbi:MAG: FHA domain-containing protein [Clostridiales Family XIII bacterium]|jgi:hypothetical protein|nr:FHA domain-containing protein [Clostridiales Family XIII bacterium]